MKTERKLMDIVSEIHPKVASVNHENMTFICENGTEYPLMEGCENLTIEELQKVIDKARSVTMNIIGQLED